MSKNFSSICLALLLTTSAWGQSEIQLQASNAPGQLIGSGSQIQFHEATLVSASVNSAQIFSGSAGTVTFTTPPLKMGTIEGGGSFGRGGSFYISSPFGLVVNATFAGGAWNRFSLPNGTYNYLLKGKIIGTMFLNGSTYSVQGMTVQLSTNTGKYVFSGSQYTTGGVTNLVVVQK